jgi:Arc/MetJ-type ribon-helix-helix transcriptional regulator
VKSKQVSFRCPEPIADSISALVDPSGKFRTHSEAIIHLLECGLEGRLQIPGELRERLRKHAEFLGRDERSFVQQAIEGMCDLIEGKKSASGLQLEYRFREELLRGNTADLEERLGFSAPSQTEAARNDPDTPKAETILAEIQIPAKRRHPSKSSALYVQSFLSSFIREEGGEISIGVLAYAYQFLLDRVSVVRKIEALDPKKVRQWADGYCEKPHASHFLLSLRDMASHRLIRVDGGADRPTVKLLKDGDGESWAGVDAAMVRAALGTRRGEISQTEVQKAKETLLPEGSINQLLAA